jgi:hypothetical protein
MSVPEKPGKPVATALVEDPSWTPQALAVAHQACAYYGGFEGFRSLRCVRLLPERISGLVPRMKGVGRTFAFTGAFEIAPHERRVRFLSFPDAAHVGVFENGAVRVERADDGTIVQFAAEHRASFGGLNKLRRWAALDALYFFGYALSHYHSLPFSLLQARLVRAGSVRWQRKTLSTLVVDLPCELPTHCQRQRFYFDEEGRLVRHDYHAEIVGFWARGAHFWRREIVRNGFPVSLERHVTARLGSVGVPMTALHATFLDAEVERGPCA